MNKIKNFDSFKMNEKFLPDSQGEIMIILGSPGSGKGTISKELKSKYGIQHISTGDLIRNSDDKDLKKLIADGSFVPDDVIIKILRKNLKNLDPAKGIIFDGFPRNMVQAKKLESMLGKMGLGLNHVIYLDIPEKVAKRRIKKRAEKEDRPDDANDDVISKRFKDYYDKTHPLMDFYDKSRKLIKIDSDKEKDEIVRIIAKRLGLKLEEK